MKKLISLEIIGFQSPDRCAKVYFSDDSISVIYGDNGCGKTTFLKLIYAILNRDNSILINENVECAILSYSSESGQVFDIKISKILMMDEVNEVVGIDYDWNDLIKSDLIDSRSLSLGVERGVTTQSLRVEPSDIFRFVSHPKYRGSFSQINVHEFSDELSNFIRNNQARRTRTKQDELSLDKSHTYLQSIKMANIGNLLADRYRVARSVAAEKIQNALFDTLSVVIESNGRQPNITKTISIPDDFDSLVLNNKDRIIEALNDGFENNFKTHIINILQGVRHKQDVQWLQENNLLSQLIMNMIKELEVEKQLLSSINTLVETFNEYLIGDKKLIVKTHDVYVEINGEQHSINELSSGERHILTFLSLVVIAGRDRDFLIIDEPEISLNIKWQRTLMSLIRKLVPYTQVIVASHSPLIAKKIPQSLVKLEPYTLFDETV
ncbi:AAA family ATPase [Aeromonas veronii]